MKVMDEIAKIADELNGLNSRLKKVGERIEAESLGGVLWEDVTYARWQVGDAAEALEGHL